MLKFILLVVPIIANAELLNSGVKQDNIHRTVCVPGYTKTIRPSSNYTNHIKEKLTDHPKDFQLDHLVPLSVGGHPSSDNLWLQPLKEAHEKDKIERKIHSDLCRGKITLQQAQEVFLKWRER